MTERIEIGGHTIELGNPSKVLFPDSGITKLDLADYYRQVGKVMLPHIRGRPVTMHRFPDGVTGTGFYQKQVPAHFPDWIATATVSKQDGEVTHVVVNDIATLVYPQTRRASPRMSGSALPITRTGPTDSCSTWIRPREPTIPTWCGSPPGRGC